jgi:hypothetical protein
MIQALVLAAVTAAQALPTASAPQGKTAPLAFADGLRRLVGDAPDAFSRDLGQRLGASGGLESYALSFAIAGLSGCRVVRNGAVAGVTCDAYRGSDDRAAAAVFDEFERRLRLFAGKDGRFSVDAFMLATERTTVAAYWPSDAVDVTVEKDESRGACSVVLKVARNPS